MADCSSNPHSLPVTQLPSRSQRDTRHRPRRRPVAVDDDRCVCTVSRTIVSCREQCGTAKNVARIAYGTAASDSVIVWRTVRAPATMFMAVKPEWG